MNESESAELEEFLIHRADHEQRHGRRSFATAFMRMVEWLREQRQQERKEDE